VHDTTDDCSLLVNKSSWTVYALQTTSSHSLSNITTHFQLLLVWATNGNFVICMHNLNKYLCKHNIYIKKNPATSTQKHWSASLSTRLPANMDVQAKCRLHLNFAVETSSTYISLTWIHVSVQIWRTCWCICLIHIWHTTVINGRYRKDTYSQIQEHYEWLEL
jgi:hypothetical protein